MIKLEDFSKQTLIAVMRNKLWNREKEVLLECSRIEYSDNFKKVSNELDLLVNENKLLTTNLEDMYKWNKNHKRIRILFNKQTALNEWFTKVTEEIRKNFKNGF